jgi:hypothetical protein
MEGRLSLGSNQSHLDAVLRETEIVASLGLPRPLMLIAEPSRRLRLRAVRVIDFEIAPPISRSSNEVS